MTKKELAYMIHTEEKRLKIGDKDFMTRHKEIMKDIECMKKGGKEASEAEGKEKKHVIDG